MVQDALHACGRENALPMSKAHGVATPAKRGPKDALKAELERAQQASPIATPQRRALQALDSNRLSTTSQSAANEAPGSSSKSVSVSPLPRLSTERKMRITQYVPSPGSAAGIASLSGQKRKLQLTESVVGRKSDPVAVAEEEKDAEPASATAENVAWLDMLLALLERRYRGRSLPVDVSRLQRADLFEHASHLSANGMASSSSQQPARADEEPSTNSSPTDEASSKSEDLPASQRKDITEAPSTKTKEQLEQLDNDREERRQQLLLRHAKQIQDTSVTSTACCGCKTGCLKMYCVCFSTRGFCHPQCTCDDCKNSRENTQQRLDAIQSYLSNDPRAFSLSSFQIKARTTGFLQLLPQKSNTTVPRGCRCKKSKCLKKYCECFQNGLACTAHCRCQDCSNHSHSEHHIRKKQELAERRGKQEAFHQIQVTVTKKPKRNYVEKTIRLRL